MQNEHANASILSLLFAWATHAARVRLQSMKPRYTTEEIASVVARTGNPTGT